MPRVFLDTNVAVDLIVKREPFYDQAKFVFDKALQGDIRLVVSSGSIISMIYLSYTTYKLPDAANAIWDLVKSCSVVNTKKQIAFDALYSDFRDKEDAYLYLTALDRHADYFITRDMKDFRTAKDENISILTPVQYADLFK